MSPTDDYRLGSSSRRNFSRRITTDFPAKGHESAFLRRQGLFQRRLGRLPKYVFPGALYARAARFVLYAMISFKRDDDSASFSDSISRDPSPDFYRTAATPRPTLTSVRIGWRQTRQIWKALEQPDNIVSSPRSQHKHSVQ